MQQEVIVRLGLVLAACIGVAFLARFLRHRIRSSRAARHGGYPPEPTRIWIAPLAAIAVVACWSAVGTYVQVHHQTPQTRLEKQLERQSKVQHAFSQELARPPARSYLDLDTRAAALRNLGAEARDVQSAVRNLNRTKYTRDEVAMIAALDGILTADLAYMDAYDRLVGQRKVQVTATGIALPPAERTAMLQRQIVVATRTIALLDGYVALKGMTPAQAAKAKATVQAAIKQMQAAQAATAPAAKQPKAKPKA
jgi:hypothetical protein